MCRRWNFCHVEQTESTNDLARELPIWSAIRADTQSAGRGRRGSAWESSKGGLWASYTIPSLKHHFPSVAIGSLIVCRLREFCESPSIRLKFPNDLYIDNAKLGGILIESPEPDRWIVGIGINVNNPLPRETQLEYPRTSLAAAKVKIPSLDLLFRQIAEWMESSLPNDSAISSAWGDEPRQVSILTKGTKISGQFFGMTPTGNLVLKVPGGRFREIPGAMINKYQEIDTPTNHKQED